MLPIRLAGDCWLETIDGATLAIWSTTPDVAPEHDPDPDLDHARGHMGEEACWPWAVDIETAHESRRNGGVYCGIVRNIDAMRRVVYVDTGGQKGQQPLWLPYRDEVREGQYVVVQQTHRGTLTKHGRGTWKPVLHSRHTSLARSRKGKVVGLGADKGSGGGPIKPEWQVVSQAAIALAEEGFEVHVRLPRLDMALAGAHAHTVAAICDELHALADQLRALPDVSKTGQGTAELISPPSLIETATVVTQGRVQHRHAQSPLDRDFAAHRHGIKEVLGDSITITQDNWAFHFHIDSGAAGHLVDCDAHPLHDASKAQRGQQKGGFADVTVRSQFALACAVRLVAVLGLGGAVFIDPPGRPRASALRGILQSFHGSTWRGFGMRILGFGPAGFLELSIERDGHPLRARLQDAAKHHSHIWGILPQTSHTRGILPQTPDLEQNAR